MRYGNPSIESVLDRLTAEGCERIVMFPLYPQYSATTTATVNDKFFERCRSAARMPAVRTVPAYHDEPVYIEALARSIERHMLRSTSSRRSSSPPTTAYQRAISSAAIPITAIA